jgi:hypothetical protein
MLDVHPAHHAAGSWKEFFIHIATIVLGLLIAISLEQTVEYFHHQHEARHARELLAEEMAANDRIEQGQRYALAMHEDYLFNDLGVLGRLRQHALAADDRIILFHPHGLLDDSAWQAAQQSGATAFFSYDEIHGYSIVYDLQSEFNSTMRDSETALQNAQTMFYSSPADRFDYSKAAPGAVFYGRSGDAAAHAAFEGEGPRAGKLLSLTPAQIDRLEQTVQQGIYQDEKLINRCDWLARDYKQISH